QPLESLKSVSTACRAGIARPNSGSMKRCNSGPDSRTTPIAARPEGVAIAATTSGFAMSGLGPLEYVRDPPLLGNGKNIVHHPVEHEPGWEEEEECAERDRHDLHQLGLHRIGRGRIEPSLDKHRRAHDDRQN